MFKKSFGSALRKKIPCPTRQGSTALVTDNVEEIMKAFEVCGGWCCGALKILSTLAVLQHDANACTAVGASTEKRC